MNLELCLEKNNYIKVENILAKIRSLAAGGELHLVQNLVESWLDEEIILALELFSQYPDFLGEEFEIMHSNLNWLESELVLLEEYEACAAIVKAREWLVQQESEMARL